MDHGFEEKKNSGLESRNESNKSLNKERGFFIEFIGGANGVGGSPYLKRFY